MRYTLGIVALLALVTPTARGDGLLYQLPDDRSWVRYDVDVTQQRDGMQQTNRATLTMASVGQSMEGAEKCRWIEVRLQMSDGGMDRMIVAKALIPEKYLKKGEAPLNQMVRGWLRAKGDDQDVVKLEASNLGPLQAFLAGPLQDEKKLEKESVDSGLGKLDCEGVSGTVPVTENGRDGKFDFQTRLHKTAPFGVVSSRLTFEFKRDGQVAESGSAVFTLADSGKDAESALPGYQ